MAKFKIVKGTINLGKDGKFAPGREAAFEKALESRKDGKSILASLKKRGFVIDNSPVASEKPAKTKKEPVKKGPAKTKSDK